MEIAFKNDVQAMDELISRIEQLHSLPQVAISILNLTRNADYDVSEVVDCLENDPALASKILKTVNSSHFGQRRKVGNLRLAVALLGQRSLRLMAMTFSLVDGLTRGSAGKLYQDYWQRAITMASVASRLSHDSPGADHHDAYAAGLVADLGVLLLAQIKQDEYVELYQAADHGTDLIEAERDCFGFCHASLGARLLEKWEFPVALVEATRSHHEDLDKEDALYWAVRAGDLMADAIWTPESPQLAVARQFLEEKFKLDLDEFIDLARWTKDDISLNAELFGIYLKQPIDCDVILARAKALHCDAVIEVARELDQVIAGQTPGGDIAAECGRHLGTAICTLYLDSDPMRTGIEVEFDEISAGEVSFQVPLPLALYEQVKINVCNEVQGFSKELRGIVRSSVRCESVRFRTEIELFARLSTLDLSTLKSAGLQDKPVDGKVWM